jgi:hypothetical protein
MPTREVCNTFVCLAALQTTASAAAAPQRPPLQAADAQVSVQTQCKQGASVQQHVSGPAIATAIAHVPAVGSPEARPSMH